MSWRFLRREAEHGQFQASANDFSDLPHRYSLFSDRVVPAACFVLLQRKLVETGNIENMRRRPAIESVTYVRRDSLLTSQLDRVGDEALLDRIVDLRKTHHRHVHTTLRHGSPCYFRSFTRIRVVGIEIVFGCGFTWNSVPHSSPGGDEQRAVRAGKHVAHRLDDLAVLLTIREKVRKVVIEGSVDDAVRYCCSAAQAFQVFQIASMHLGSGGDEGLGARLRTR